MVALAHRLARVQIIRWAGGLRRCPGMADITVTSETSIGGH